MNHKFLILYFEKRGGVFAGAFDSLNKTGDAHFVQYTPGRFYHRFFSRLAFANRIRFPMQKQLAAYYWQKEVREILSEMDWMKNDEKPPVLISSHGFVRCVKNGVIEVLKEQYPDLKVVYYFSDIIKTKRVRKEIIDHPERYSADLVLTFDPGDAEKYGLTCCRLPFGMTFSDNSNIRYEVCFIGRAKERYPEILEIYDYLIRKGVTCKFYVITEDEKIQDRRAGIEYRKHAIPYEEYLNIEKESRCLLEIIQDGSCGYTARVPEAVFLSKKLITNNQAMLSDENYDPKNILVFQKAEDIDVDFIRNEEPALYKEEFREVFNPQRFLQLVDDKLNEKFD